MPKVLIDVQKAQICRLEETRKWNEIVGILAKCDQ
jgi:hypothetical protein